MPQPVMSFRIESYKKMFTKTCFCKHFQKTGTSPVTPLEYTLLTAQIVAQFFCLDFAMKIARCEIKTIGKQACAIKNVM
jgi:hypothetical protein